MFGERPVACSTATVAHAGMCRPVRFGTLPAAVGPRFTAPTVPQLASGSGESPALRARHPSHRAFFRSGSGRGLSNFGIQLAECVAKVVAQVVHGDGEDDDGRNDGDHGGGDGGGGGGTD